VVSDLDRNHASGVEHFDLRLEIARMFFNLRKFSHDLAGRVEDAGCIFCTADGLRPGSNQCVSRFHPLREMGRAITFHARFRK
jgi:hypothetical protein